jgi:hypothetical protein
MSLIALKFVWAALIVLIIVSLIWLVVELQQAPADVQRLARRILGVAVAIVLVVGLVALLAPIAGAVWWWSFG